MPKQYQDRESEISKNGLWISHDGDVAVILPHVKGDRFDSSTTLERGKTGIHLSYLTNKGDSRVSFISYAQMPALIEALDFFLSNQPAEQESTDDDIAKFVSMMMGKSPLTDQ